MLINEYFVLFFRMSEKRGIGMYIIAKTGTML